MTDTESFLEDVHPLLMPQALELAAAPTAAWMVDWTRRAHGVLAAAVGGGGPWTVEWEHLLDRAGVQSSFWNDPGPVPTSAPESRPREDLSVVAARDRVRTDLRSDTRPDQARGTE